ncbi:6-phosphogluconolactonase [Nocardioides sp. HM23]|uniref:6-phosphogluconolactonase n=1 Tax=Nocardioides bizhenqiangii TaxID=3095076 RepID=UPI002ACABEDE|nr:6-phosphogluconolactonase [Nocardioides sp. HM23]MDZ5620321.1 6-phosphogluconolactonase [Nocardioides sp. HM23]
MIADRPPPLIEVQPDAETLATAVAGELLNRIADAQAAGNVPHIGLTGGTIADAVHREVARMAADSGVDWGTVHFWFGDERFVAADSPDRNALQARAAFLDAVGATRVHEVPAADQVADAEAAAAAYADDVRTEGGGAFDVLMLGIGPDGHVASLFPGHPALEVTDTVAAAVHDSPKPPPDRVTLTFETLERSHAVWFLAAGDTKADAVARALADDGSVAQTPARGVRGLVETTFFLDHAAASRL